MRVNGFMAVGLLLVAVAFIAPSLFATVITDNTPPIITLTVPGNGQVYQPNATGTSQLFVYAHDSESGIKNGSFTVDGSTYALSYLRSTAFDEIWMYQYPFALASGSHSFSATVYNKAGLSALSAGNFQVYQGLTGTWYVNNEAITSTAQTVYSKNLTVQFKFAKIAGMADQQITCQIREGASLLSTLSLTSTGVWTGTYTFTGGTHVLSLMASDGTQTITMGLVNLDFGDSISHFAVQFSGLQWGLLLGGVGLVAYGYLKQKKET